MFLYMCSTKQCPKLQLHIHLQKIPYLYHSLPITLKDLFPLCLQNEDGVVICTSNMLLKFNTLGKFLPSVVKSPSLGNKISHKAIILRDTLNPSPDHSAESTFHICLMRLTVSNVKEDREAFMLTSFPLLFSLYYFIATQKLRIDRKTMHLQQICQKIKILIFEEACPQCRSKSVKINRDKLGLLQLYKCCNNRAFNAQKHYT